MKRTLISMVAKEYAETGKIPYCPTCGSRGVKTQEFVYSVHRSLSVICPKCGEIGHFDGIANETSSTAS